MRRECAANWCELGGTFANPSQIRANLSGIGANWCELDGELSQIRRESSYMYTQNRCIPMQICANSFESFRESVVNLRGVTTLVHVRERVRQSNKPDKRSDNPDNPDDPVNPDNPGNPDNPDNPGNPTAISDRIP
jgi:hypothetical protein